MLLGDHGPALSCRAGGAGRPVLGKVSVHEGSWRFSGSVSHALRSTFGRRVRLRWAPAMKTAFQTLLKAARKARKSSLSVALAFQRVAPTSKPPRKRAKTETKRANASRPSASRRPSWSKPASFVDGQFSCPHGALAYKLYSPKGSNRRRSPLVVMLHGCAQSAAEFAAGAGMNKLADELGLLVLYPQQSRSANLGRCWNWHRPDHQQRGRGEPAVIAALTSHVITTCKANPAQVYIAGISAGGAAAAIVAAAYPEIYAAVGVHSGLAPGNITTLSAALSMMRTGVGAQVASKAKRPLPTIVFHGDQDSVVHPFNAGGFLIHLQRSTRQSITSRAERGRSTGGREFTRTLYRQGAGAVLLEDWTVHGSGHAWSGGSLAGAHTDPAGPDASRAMIRFFLTHKRAGLGSRRTKAVSPAKD